MGSNANISTYEKGVNIGLKNCQTSVNTPDLTVDVVRNVDFDDFVIAGTWLTGKDSDQNGHR